MSMNEDPVMQAVSAASRLRPSELLAGTPVLTLSGAIPVEFVGPGDKLVTRSGVQAVTKITSRHVPLTHVIRISAKTFVNFPTGHDLRLAMDQEVLIRDWRALALTGRKKAMIPLGRLVDGEFICPEVIRDQQAVRLHFAEPQVIYTGNLEVLIA
jgi:hypothetical protein